MRITDLKDGLSIEDTEETDIVLFVPSYERSVRIAIMIGKSSASSYYGKYWRKYAVIFVDNTLHNGYVDIYRAMIYENER